MSVSPNAIVELGDVCPSVSMCSDLIVNYCDNWLTRVWSEDAVLEDSVVNCDCDG